jgi:hypothetical protein
MHHGNDICLASPSFVKRLRSKQVSRKGAKPQRPECSGKLCAFAPLREPISVFTICDDVRHRWHPLPRGRSTECVRMLNTVLGSQLVQRLKGVAALDTAGNDLLPAPVQGFGQTVGQIRESGLVAIRKWGRLVKLGCWLGTHGQKESLMGLAGNKRVHNRTLKRS